MEFIIKIELDDVNTYRLGKNFAIDGYGVTVVFSPEAAEEFIRDVRSLAPLSLTKLRVAPMDTIVILRESI